MSMLLFVLILLVGLFMGATIILSLAYLLDNHNEREIMRRAKMVADYMNEYDIDAKTAYQTLKLLNFDY